MTFSAVLAGVSVARAQVAIQSISTTLTTGTQTSTKLDGTKVNFENDTLAVSTFTDQYGVFTASALSTNAEAFVRTDGSPETTQSTMWYMGPTATSKPGSLDGTLTTSNEANQLLGNNLLQGAYDTFVNSSSVTSNDNSDVERLDFLYNGTAGTAATSSLSIGVFDLGTQASFEIAVITGVSTNGTPTSYGGTLLTVTTSDFSGQGLLTTSNGGSTFLNAGTDSTDYLLRYDSSTSLGTATTQLLSYSTDVTSNISGVVISMADLGITAGTTIYGYSLMAADVTDSGNINNLVNYSNTTYFPDATSDSGAFAALDPASVNGVMFSFAAMPEPSQYAEVFLTIAIAVYGWRRKREASASAGKGL